MSTALANVTRLKPEIRLAQAVSQFDADLSSDQKATLVHTDLKFNMLPQMLATSCASPPRLTVVQLGTDVALDQE